MQPTPISFSAQPSRPNNPGSPVGRPNFRLSPLRVVARLRWRSRAALLSTFAAVPLALVGCRDPKVSVYQVPKEPEAVLPASAPTSIAEAATPPEPVLPPAGIPSAANAPAASSDPHALQTTAGSSLAWTAPSEWQPKSGSAMRKATFVVGSGSAAPAELAVTAFPGDVGGELANVNRWRGQVGLPELPDPEAAAAIQRIEANGLKIAVVDVAESSAPGATRLLGAMVPYQGATWFFKLVGPTRTVEQAKPAFLEFLKTVKPAAAPNP